MSNIVAPLFHPEVTQAHAAQRSGSIRIGRSPSSNVVTGLAVAIAIALVSLAIWGESVRKVSAPGVGARGCLMLHSSPRAATVAEVLVREGDRVEAGQVLIGLCAERMLAGSVLGQLQRAAVVQSRGSLASELRLVEQQAQQRSSDLLDRLPPESAV